MQNNSGTGLDFSRHLTTNASTIDILNNIVVNTAVAYVGPTTGTSTTVTSSGNNLFFNHGTITGLSLVASDLNAPPEFVQDKKWQSLCLANSDSVNTLVFLDHYLNKIHIILVFIMIILHLDGLFLIRISLILIY